MPLFNKYRVDYKKLIVWLLPSPVRKPVAIRFLLALITPVVALYNQFLSFRAASLYKLLITPQVVYLEKALNDRYDTTARRIYITDGVEYPFLYVYTQSESKPVAVYTAQEALPVFLYTKAETGAFSVDFVVCVPAGILYDANELSALVNSYKLASKKFKIKIV